MTDPAISGSSPWMLTMASSSRSAATSASRSVPVGWSARVITTSAPKSLQAWAMRGSSVATNTSSSRRAVRAPSQTCCTIGLPPIGVRGLPGNRVAW